MRPTRFCCLYAVAVDMRASALRVCDIYTVAVHQEHGVLSRKAHSELTKAVYIFFTIFYDWRGITTTRDLWWQFCKVPQALVAQWSYTFWIPFRAPVLWSYQNIRQPEVASSSICYSRFSPRAWVYNFYAGYTIYLLYLDHSRNNARERVVNFTRITAAANVDLASESSGDLLSII